MPLKLLAWPVSYDHFNFLGKDYMFFGDIHNLNKACNEACAEISPDGTFKNTNSFCWNFDYFLTTLMLKMKNTQKVLDVFLELGYFHSYNQFTDVFMKGSYIAKTAESPFIKQCLNVDKRMCKFNPYSRVHYADLRLLYNKNITTYKSPADIGNYDILEYLSTNWQQDYIQEILEDLLKNRKFKKFFDFYFDSDDYIEDVREFLGPVSYPVGKLMMKLGQILKVHPIRKQYLKLKQQNPQLAGAVREFISLKVLDYTAEPNMNIMVFAMTLFNNVSGLVIDAYTLLRMFRDFDNPAKVCIVYMGSHHTALYNNFFTNFLNCKLLSSPELSAALSLRMIDIPDSKLKHDMAGPDIKCLDVESELGRFIEAPNITENTLDCIFRDTGILDKVSKTREYIYGYITSSNKSVEIFENNVKYLVDNTNVTYTLKVGSDKLPYYYKSTNLNRVYFKTKDFIRGYNRGSLSGVFDQTIYDKDGKTYHYVDDEIIGDSNSSNGVIVTINGVEMTMSKENLAGLIYGLNKIVNVNIALSYLGQSWPNILLDMPRNSAAKYILTDGNTVITFDNLDFLVGIKTAYNYVGKPMDNLDVLEIGVGKIKIN